MPAEHRVLGLDRRSLPFALAAVVVWLLWVVVLPSVNGLIGWDDPVRAGDRLQVSDQVSFVPSSGWGIQQGLRSSDRTRSGRRSEPVALVDGGVQLRVTTGTWTGSPRALLDQVEEISTATSGRDGLTFTGSPASIQSTSGLTGALQSFRSPRVEGHIATYVVGGQGIEVQVVGPPDEVASHSQDVLRMILSVRDDRRATS